jgi:hypothetical protein
LFTAEDAEERSDRQGLFLYSGSAYKASGTASRRHQPRTKELTMEISAAEQTLRDRAFKAMVEATYPLQTGPDQEVILQALIHAAEMLKERFEQELEELRQEAD